MAIRLSSVESATIPAGARRTRTRPARTSEPMQHSAGQDRVSIFLSIVREGFHVRFEPKKMAAAGLEDDDRIDRTRDGDELPDSANGDTYRVRRRQGR